MNIYRQHTHDHSVGWSTWHFEWCTKYRYKSFYSEKRRNLYKILLPEAAKKHNITIIDCEVDIDHVHVVASIPLTMAPLLAVQYLKGITAKGLFIELPQLRTSYKKEAD